MITITTKELELLLNWKNGFYRIKKGDKCPSPLDYLEMSVACCISHGILKYMKEHFLDINPFGEIKVYFKQVPDRWDEVLAIKADTKQELKHDLGKIITDCYISNHLTFTKEIHV
jgi:uncharacterized OsmC-like protein